MADEPTTPPTDDDDIVVEHATDTAATDATTDATDATDATTELPRTEPAPAVPVVAAPGPHWSPDRRSVVVTLVAVAALAASFGLGWAAGAANDDDDGDARRVGYMQRFERGGAPGDMQGGRPGGAGSDRGQRPGGFDRGFDGPRGRDDDASGGDRSSRGDDTRMSMRGGVVGTITKIDGDTLTIEAIGPAGSGSTKVELDDEVDVIVRAGGDRESGSRDDLKEGVIIAAHGDSDGDEDDDAIDADRIVVLRAAE